MIGDVIPNDDANWKCFMILEKIVDITVCPRSSADLCGILKVLIAEHHRAFIEICSENEVTPKCHFLLHYPQQILGIGPIRAWNMRNEAKLNIFKQASRLGNFKNIASRHQRLLCYELSTPTLHSPVECGPCNPSQPITSEPFCVQSSLQLLPDISTATELVAPHG